MATLKALRQPPSKIFEHYVLTRTTAPGAGLVDIPDLHFSNVTMLTWNSLFLSDEINDDDGNSELIEIGFDFSFDNVIYRRMIIGANGYIILADPVLTRADLLPTISTGATSSLSPLGGTPWQNSLINSSSLTNSTLLCPWFDDLRGVIATGAEAEAEGFITFNDQQRQRSGFEVPSITYNNVDYGVKIYHDNKSTQGRRTIVRWNSLSDYTNASTVIKFETVLYENGTIEFRYSPRRNLTLTETTFNGLPVESATVGIFARGTNRFRDFSPGFGYLDSARQIYKYGGAVHNSTFIDSGFDNGFDQTVYSASYVWQLRSAAHWPSLTNVGTILRFAPPQKHRVILPKNVLRNRDSQLRTQQSLFDDRKSVNYVSDIVVNYPTTLPRFLGDSEAGVSSRQNLFLGSDGDFFVTGGIVRSAVEQFLEVQDESVIRPFSENARFDQGYAARNDSFYSSGSGTEIGERFDTQLSSKSQIRFSLPVNYTTQLQSSNGSLYYYNCRAAVWTMPANTLLSGSDKANLIMGTGAHKIPEDHRGFGPIGTSITSGSNNWTTNALGTDLVLNSPFTTEQTASLASVLTRDFSKSITKNQEYRATVDETFTIPVTHPFLIEKAVFEIPIICGPGWFEDKTTSFSTLYATSRSGTIDFGGPGITVALLNQISIGESTKRDLIMTGTISHIYDTKEVTLSNFPSISSDFHIRPTGFLSYTSEPSVRLAPNNSEAFTGSVVVKSEALVSNGVILKFSKDMNAEPSTEYQANRDQVLQLIDQPQLTLMSASGLYSHGFNIAYVNNFGRSNSGFDPSGRSIFGKEFSTNQGVVIDGNKVANPFYLTGSARTQISSSLASGNKFRAIAAIPLIAHFKSPYLTLPGDRLILALAKSRPVYYSNSQITSGSSHDVLLITGTINISLYGSYLKEGKEFHGEIQQKLTSPAVHETIGMDPVLDQFEVAYKEEYVGGMFDDFVTGSLVTRTKANNQTTMLLSGNRGRVFSKANARSQAAPDLSGAEIAANPSKAFRTQPWWERVGTPRVTSHRDSSEVYWDSLMPNITDCFNADGSSIYFKDPVVNFGSSLRINPNTGYVIFDSYSDSLSDPLDQKLYNRNWSKAYPFEPRYSQAPRQKTLEKSFIASLEDVFLGDVTQIEPVQVSGFFINAYSGFVLDAVETTVGLAITGSATLADMSRVLFGFGDKNNVAFVGSPHDPFGTNHGPTFRHTQTISGFAGSNVGLVGPIIRGWKYGVHSGLRSYSKIFFRNGRFGQYRDMLEQRPFTKFFVLSSISESGKTKKDTITSAPIHIRFVNASGSTTNPSNTSAQNLSFEATSSFPYFDGVTRNR